MRAALLSLALLSAACAGTAAGGGKIAPVAAPPVPAAPAAVTVDGLLGRTQDEGSVLLRLSVARQHPLGARLVPFVLAWPGWGATITSLTGEPLADLEWIDIVGPKDPARERMLTRTAAPDETIDTRLQGRSDGSLRVVERGQPHMVAALPPDGAQAILQSLRTSRLQEPDHDDEDGDEVLHVDFPHPHGVMLYVPSDVRRAVVRAYSRPGGAAEGFAELTVDDEATATRMAGELQARADSMNNLMVRVLTRGLLGGLAIKAEGAVVKLRLPANREQLESLATLASAMLPGSSRH
jgi:hypothetical protein